MERFSHYVQLVSLAAKSHSQPYLMHSVSGWLLHQNSADSWTRFKKTMTSSRFQVTPACSVLPPQVWTAPPPYLWGAEITPSSARSIIKRPTAESQDPARGGGGREWFPLTGGQRWQTVGDVSFQKWQPSPPTCAETAHDLKEAPLSPTNSGSTRGACLTAVKASRPGVTIPLL